MPSSKIAIVVPVLNDRNALDRLLIRINTWSTRPAQVIVVSGAESPEASELCQRYQCRYLETDPGRGGQLDKGARSTDAPILWFLHADAEPPLEGLNSIVSVLAEGAEGGYFRFSFSGPPQWYKKLLAAAVNARTRLGGVPYGDQGLFMRRDVYLACGGFAHQPLFEEVDLVKKLKARGKFRALDLAIGVSPRRWERDGWCRRTLLNRRMALAYMRGVPAERLASDYH